MIKIRTFGFLFFLIAYSLHVSGIAQGATPEPIHLSSAAQRPNVLFIAIDDLNDWVGAMGGHPQAITPNLDRLASRGVLFEKAYCTVPLCNASRAALMTGIEPFRSGVYANRPQFRESPLLKDAVTLPEYFRSHGYHTMRGGKIYHHKQATDPRSWNEAFPSLDIHIPEINVAPNHDEIGLREWGYGPLDIPEEEMDDAQVASWAVEQLNKQHDKPFFLAAGFFHPHLPVYAPRKYFDMHPIENIVLPEILENDRDDLPEIAKTYNNLNGYERHQLIVKEGLWDDYVQAYLASTSFVDAQVGRVLDALADSKHADNTIVVLWSDHGWHLGEKLHWSKFSLWEEATRVVLMVAGPGVKEGGRCAKPVGLIDLYPTLVDYCGLPSKDGLDGLTLQPMLKNPNASRDRPAMTTHGRKNFSLRTEDWRYTRWRDGSEELYNHSEDPDEWHNLASNPEYNHIKQDMQKWLPDESAQDLFVRDEFPKRSIGTLYKPKKNKPKKKKSKKKNEE